MESVLHAALGHRLVGPRQVDMVTAFCGKEQHRIAMLLPILAQQLQRALRQWDIAVFRAFTVADVNHHPGAIDVGDVQIDSFLQPQAAGVNGGEADLVAWQFDASQNLAHLFAAQDDWKLLFPRRA